MHDSSFSLIKIQGADAKKFLQGQVTCDVESLKEGFSLLGAHCNPQGRVLFLFRLFKTEESYYLILPKDLLTTALNALAKFARFFKLELQEASETATVAIKTFANQEWQYFKVSLKRPQIYLATSGKFLPHDLGLEEQGALSWTKGCYTGQEIIARMHYRGKSKNHLYAAKLQSKTRPEPGQEFFCKTEQGIVPAATLVDYQEEAKDHYLVLVIANENDLNKGPLFLNPEQSEAWQWLL